MNLKIHQLMLVFGNMVVCMGGVSFIVMAIVIEVLKNYFFLSFLIIFFFLSFSFFLLTIFF